MISGSASLTNVPAKSVHFRPEFTALVHRMDRRADPYFLPDLVVILTVRRRDVDDAGTVFGRHEIRLDHVEALLRSTGW